MFCPFSSSEGPSRVLEGPQWFTIDNLACHKNLGQNLLLWEDLTMGKLGVTHMEEEKNIWFETCFSCFWFLNGVPRVPKAPLCSQFRDLVCHKYSNEIFHYERISLWENLMFSQRSWEKEYLMIFCIFWPFSGYEGSSRAQRVPEMVNIACHEKLRLLFNYEMISFWEIECNSHQR